MDVPRITVVMPSFNQAQYLPDAIASVLDQGYPELEFLVLDGGSTDGSPDIIERHAEHLHWWRSESDEGQAASLREGFERASGDVLTWLNSDDLLADGALRRVADTWTRHGGGVIIAGSIQLFENTGPTSVHTPSFQRSFDVAQPMPHERIFDLARHWFPGEFYYQPEVFFPRETYEQVGGVDPSYYYTMDYDLWVRFALAGTPVVVIEDVLAWYREHDQQKTHDKQALYDEMIRTANAYLPSSNLDGPTQQRLVRSNQRARSRWVREGYKLLHRVGAFR